MTVKEYLEEKLEGVKASIEKAAKMYVVAKVLYAPGYMLEGTPKEVLAGKKFAKTTKMEYPLEMHH